MTPTRWHRRGLRAACLIVTSLSLSGCGWLFGWSERNRAPDPDPSVTIYQAAMAEFSTCAATADPTARANAAASLAQAMAEMQALDRPSNPDHFYLADRVTAAHGYCAEAATR